MRLLTVAVKVETIDGSRTAQWTGAFDETVLVVAPGDMDEDAFRLLLQQYIHAGLRFADCVRCA